VGVSKWKKTTTGCGEISKRNCDGVEATRQQKNRGGVPVFSTVVVIGVILERSELVEWPVPLVQAESVEGEAD